MEERITSIVDHAMGMEQKFLEKRNWVEYIVRTANRELCTKEIERAKREIRHQIEQIPESVHYMPDNFQPSAGDMKKAVLELPALQAPDLSDKE